MARKAEMKQDSVGSEINTEVIRRWRRWSIKGNDSLPHHVYHFDRSVCTSPIFVWDSEGIAPSTMAASMEDSIQVSLVRPDPSDSALKPIHLFHPIFTYPIFGEEERIFGYQGLDINIRFAAHDCRPHVAINYEKKFPKVGDVRPTDCTKILKEYMPPVAFENTYDSTVTQDFSARSWTPPGEVIHTYKRNGRTFEVWSGSLSDTNVRFLLDQIQIFVLLFIEGGQMLVLDDPEWTLNRWQVYFIYEKTQVPDQPNVSPYVLAGYATTYRCYKMTIPASRPTKSGLESFPDVEVIDPTLQDCRLRVSQVLVLPPFQANGHGSELFRIIYKRVMNDNSICELTVEDPSEEFDKLRDSHDWKVLEPVFRAANITINTSAVASQTRYDKFPKKKLLDLPKLEKMRKEHKISPRQFYRALELYFLSQIPYSRRAAGGASLTKLLVRKHRSSDPVDVKYYWLRNLIKNRIWLQNSDKLVNVPRDEVVEKVSDSTRAQEDEYEGYLLNFAAKAAGDLNGAGLVVGSSAGGAARKRKIIDDDDDDEGAVSDASKKARSAR
ncbi:hypothetical protein Dsin_032899 [Dipteronia sinensis]|uniref:Histone acetyltransferase type B catalytic subunit n=1 Tax=Dipteronia sinensis TaxID=43782 RepID=A0AAD9Z557_9ROSI|nr:hypothetical protein Dsin_032899 [Dipteronia sinensis]